MSMFDLWCYIQGKRNYFGVSISRDSRIDHLKDEIYKKGSEFFAGRDAPDLNLTKVRYIMFSM